MNYTDKYLIHDITNKQFKRKYGVMSNRIPRRRRIGSFNHKKGNTPYKWYNPDKRECKLQPEDQAHLDSIREGERK
jgi:hypothetical protein